MDYTGRHRLNHVLTAKYRCESCQPYATAWTAASGGDGGGVSANETAANKDLENAGGVVMAMRHKTRPHYGVQFHPESICSEFGDTLYRNFTRLATEHEEKNHQKPKTAKSENDSIRVPRGLDPAGVAAAAPSTARVAAPGSEEGDGPTKLLWMKVPNALPSIPGGTEAVYWGLYGGSGGLPGDKSEASIDSFWLDSATAATAGLALFTSSFCSETPVDDIQYVTSPCNTTNLTPAGSANPRRRLRRKARGGALRVESS
jgi:hypothetical protein